MLMLQFQHWEKWENASTLFIMDTICPLAEFQPSNQQHNMSINIVASALKGSMNTEYHDCVLNHYFMFLTVCDPIFPKQISCCCEASPQLSETGNKAGNVSWKAAYHRKDAMFVLNHRHHTPTSRNSMPNWHLLSESPVSRSLEGLLCRHGSLEL